jgi:4Fe-4S ferredoxin
MPIRQLKKETSEKLVVEKHLYTKRYSLTLYKAFCKICEMCKEVCPKEAIKIKYVAKDCSGKIRPPIIDINEQKCLFCGICELICPFGALKVEINGEHVISALEAEAFPKFIRKIKIDMSKCEPSCSDCVKSCPLFLIKRTLGRSPINLDKNHCPCCRICEIKCGYGAIHVEKIFQGLIKINQEKCPDGCRECMNACPIPGALYLSKNGKVATNPLYCIFCGACRIICQKEGTIKLERISVNHTSTRSGAWIKALEKLTSTKCAVKELYVVALKKKQEVVRKRLA